MSDMRDGRPKISARVLMERSNLPDALVGTDDAGGRVTVLTVKKVLLASCWKVV